MRREAQKAIKVLIPLRTGLRFGRGRPRGHARPAVLIPLRTGLRFGPRKPASNGHRWERLNPLKNGSQIRTEINEWMGENGRLNPLKNGSQIRTRGSAPKSLAARVLIPLRTGLRFGRPGRPTGDRACLNPLKNGSQIRTGCGAPIGWAASS